MLDRRKHFDDIYLAEETNCPVAGKPCMAGTPEKEEQHAIS
jgi:hypothetical protein